MSDQTENGEKATLPERATMDLCIAVEGIGSTLVRGARAVAEWTYNRGVMRRRAATADSQPTPTDLMNGAPQPPYQSGTPVSGPMPLAPIPPSSSDRRTE